MYNSLLEKKKLLQTTLDDTVFNIKKKIPETYHQEFCEELDDYMVQYFSNIYSLQANIKHQNFDNYILNYCKYVI